MPADTISKMLAAKYDLIYQNEMVSERPEQDSHNVQPEPVQVEGWPADRWQALVYLVRTGGRLLEIGCGRGQVLATLAPHFDEVVGKVKKSNQNELVVKLINLIKKKRIKLTDETLNNISAASKQNV